MQPSIGARILLAAIALSFTVGCAGQKPALKVGTPIDVEKPVSIASLSSAPESFVGQTVRLEGTVSGVCKGSGCWVEVKGADGAVMLARSLDHSILVPTDCEGKRIVVQGVMTALPAEAHDEPQPADHECPRPTYVVSTSGVELY